MWTREGLVDFVVPMLHIPWDRMQSYVETALESVHDRHMYVGVGAYELPPEIACKHIESARAAGAPGIVLYSYHYLGPNSEGTPYIGLSDLATVFSGPASTPTMPWRK